MGGDSSSSSTTNNVTTNTSSSVGVSGDNAGTIISGVNGSTINNTTTVTDHGAIEGALDTVGDALDSIVANNEASFDFAGDALDKIIASNNATIDKTMGVVSSSNDNLKDLAMQSAASGKDTMNFASEMMTNALSKIENVATGGQSGQTDAMTKVIVVIAVMGGVAMTVKAWKG